MSAFPIVQQESVGQTFFLATAPRVWAALPPHHNIHLDAFLHAGGLSDGVHGCVLPHTGAIQTLTQQKAPSRLRTTGLLAASIRILE